MDVIGVLTDSVDTGQYIIKMRKRDSELEKNWGTICTPLEMIAKDGKKRKILAANTEGIFRIIQSIPSPKAEATTTKFTQVRDSIGFQKLKIDARDGGDVAGRTRKDIERRTNRKISTKDNYLHSTQDRKRITGN